MLAHALFVIELWVSYLFVKDLQNVGNLNQLKWIFDKDKVTSLNKQAFLDKLEVAGKNGEINSNTLNKYGGSVESLIQRIDSEFNTIFQVK